MADKDTIKVDNRVLYIVAYFGLFLTGIVLFLVADDKRLKFHSMQAFILGILFIIVATFFSYFVGFIAAWIEIIIWLYALYLGFEAYKGSDIGIPIVVDYAKSYSGFGAAISKK